MSMFMGRLLTSMVVSLLPIRKSRGEAGDSRPKRIAIARAHHDRPFSIPGSHS